MEPIHRPPGIFKGVNFVTPSVDEYYKGAYHGIPVYIELSHGTGMLGYDRVYGVTVRKSDGSEFGLSEDPSKCCFSLQEAKEYINTFQP